MNLLDTILSNPALVGQVAQQLNLDANDAQSAMKHMLPALGKGIANNMSKEGGLEGLLGALSSGSHQKYIDSPDILGKNESITDGNAILGHILGSKDVSRNVAGHASQATGVDFGILKKMLPMLATMVMGSLSKQTSQAGMLEQGTGGGLGDLLGGALGGGGGALGGLVGSMLGGGQKKSGAMDILGSFLDADKDGSALDDILGMAKKFF